MNFKLTSVFWNSQWLLSGKWQCLWLCTQLLKWFMRSVSQHDLHYCTNWLCRSPQLCSSIFEVSGIAELPAAPSPSSVRTRPCCYYPRPVKVLYFCDGKWHCGMWAYCSSIILASKYYMKENISFNLFEFYIIRYSVHLSFIRWYSVFPQQCSCQVFQVSAIWFSTYYESNKRHFCYYCWTLWELRQNEEVCQNCDVQNNWITKTQNKDHQQYTAVHQRLLRLSIL